ncbi:MAG: ADP-ribosylglycohydrolase family protein, partial [Myxococcales bacterium]|nr:ADP-ribosylglycohydrolase family protein [Myxococcales bacterium]
MPAAANPRQRVERIRGSLHGLLVGDAMGCPVEGWSPDKIKRRFGVLATLEEGTGFSCRPRGLHSDDGQQAVALCDAILEDPDAPATGFAARLVALYSEGPKGRGLFGHHRGTGRNFRATVRALAKEGADLYSASQPSAGNGNAMLIAPAAWYWSDDLETLHERVIDVSLVKQHSGCGVASAAAVAFVVAHAIREGSLATLQFPALLAYVEESEARVHRRLVARGLATEPDTIFSKALRTALARFDRPRREVLDTIAALANETADRKVYATSGYAVASVLLSLYMALSARSVVDAILDTVNLGGDADTTGAMVGAMAGASFGARKLPREWVAGLVAGRSFDDRVAAMAERRVGFRPAKSLVEIEAGFTEALILPELERGAALQFDWGDDEDEPSLFGPPPRIGVDLPGGRGRPGAGLPGGRQRARGRRPGAINEWGLPGGRSRDDGPDPGASRRGRASADSL